MIQYVRAAGWTAFVAAVLLLPVPARSSTRVALAIHAGYNEYDMTDVNQDLITHSINELILGGSGFALEEIHHGLGFGAGLRFHASKRFSFALDYDRLTAKSHLSLFNIDFNVKAPAHSVTGSAIYWFPSATRVRGGVGAGGGYYWSNGEFGADTSGVGVTTPMTGSGPGFHGMGLFDYTISPKVHFEANAGLRWAETKDLEIEGAKAVTSDGSNATLDWSGFMSRIGLTFYFGPGEAVPGS
ncbi:MAG TPA: hypothetical protein VFR25_01455 [Candidatus Eisenbacteria bacterium]|nr:hypothetical protein [Candidatus Eisenbacteria bacterium]